MKIEFEIPDLPPMPNTLLRKHWRKISSTHNKWHLLVRIAVGSRKPRHAFAMAKVTLTRFSSTRPDYDGLVGSFKPVLDGLTISKIIADDSHEVIGLPDYQWRQIERKQGKIRVTVEQIKGDK